MQTYSYKARDKNGKLITGTLEAESEREVVNKLREQDCVVTVISEDVGFSLQDFSVSFKGVSQRDIILFTAQLASLSNSGMTLLASLRMLSGHTDNKKLRAIIEELSKDIEGGSSLSEAFSKHPKVFNGFFCSMVRSGEETGKLDIVLNSLSSFQERQLELIENVKSSLIYPIILIVVSTAVIIFIVTSIIPTFVKMFKSASISLPLITTLLYNLGNFLINFWHILLFGILAAVFLIKFYISTPKGAYNADSFVLNMPFFGGLFRKLSVSRFARTFSMLVSSGVPILQSLIIVENVVGNKVIANDIRKAREAVAGGSSINESLKDSTHFPRDAVQMISAGEESGELEFMLNKVADFYDIDITYNLKRLVSLLEPFFLLVLGGVVIVIMASVLLPIFDMIKIIKR